MFTYCKHLHVNVEGVSWIMYLISIQLLPDMLMFCKLIEGSTVYRYSGIQRAVLMSESRCKAFNNVHQIRIVFPLIETQSAMDLLCLDRKGLDQKGDSGGRDNRTQCFSALLHQVLGALD